METWLTAWDCLHWTFGLDDSLRLKALDDPDLRFFWQNLGKPQTRTAASDGDSPSIQGRCHLPRARVGW